jgi:hypothetical protein
MDISLFSEEGEGRWASSLNASNYASAAAFRFFRGFLPRLAWLSLCFSVSLVSLSYRQHWSDRRADEAIRTIRKTA